MEDASSSEPSRELLLYCWGFCVALTGHHKSEDGSLFPKIVQARPDLAPVIARLTQDHSMIGYLVGGLEHAIKAGTPKDETLRHLDGIEAVMETHFGYEERQLIEVLNAADGLGLGLQNEDPRAARLRATDVGNLITQRPSFGISWRVPRRIIPLAMA